MPCMLYLYRLAGQVVTVSLSTGVLSEIVDRQTGQMARTPQLLEFAKTHGLKCITVADIVRYLDAHAIRLTS